MSDSRRSAVFGLTAFGVLSSPLVNADGLDPVISAARESKPLLELRWRAEEVDQSGMSEEADAVTLRARAGFETGKAWNTSLLAEADLVWPLSTHYNSTVNGKTGYPIVADPETYEVNRLQLTNTSLPDTTLVLGRQRIILDDHRFVGNVGWRQNEQTYDGFRITNKSFKNLTIDVSYIDQVNRVFSKDSPVGRFEGDNYLANVSYQFPAGKLTGFAYLLDFEEAPTDSSATYGLRFSGKKPAGRIELSYSASFATQSDRANNPLNYDADFYALELIGTYKEYGLGAGFEILEGDGTKAFSTPLATLHKFQGWADKFLTTPPNGIDDRYVTASYTRKAVGVLDSLGVVVTFHSYEAENVSADYGTELNIELQARWKRFSGVLKYADYDADGFATDTSKLWAQIDFVW